MQTRKLIANILTPCLILVGTVYADTEPEEGEDEPIKWTYTDGQRKLVERWQGSKGVDLPASALPESIRHKLGITSSTISPAIYFSTEVQDALRQLPKSERHRGVALDDYAHPSIMTSRTSEMQKYLSGYDQESLRKRYAAFAGIPDPENLPPDVIAQLNQISDHMQLTQLELLGHDQLARDRDSYASKDFTDAVSSLHPIDRIRLSPFLGGTVDVQSLYEAIPKMTEEQTLAAYRLIGKLEEEPEKSNFNLPPKEMRKVEFERNQGYGLRSNYPSPASILKKRIELSFANPKGIFKNDIFGRRIYRLDQPEARDVLLELTHVPDTYFDGQTESYLIQEVDSAKSTRFYSSTAFGGAMTIEEMEVHNVGVHYPNLQIAQRDAYIMQYLHSEDQWITKLMGFNGSKRFLVIVEAKLDGEEREEFIQFCRDFIEVGT